MTLLFQMDLTSSLLQHLPHSSLEVLQATLQAASAASSASASPNSLCPPSPITLDQSIVSSFTGDVPPVPGSPVAFSSTTASLPSTSPINSSEGTSSSPSKVLFYLRSLFFSLRNLSSPLSFPTLFLSDLPHHVGKCVLRVFSRKYLVVSLPCSPHSLVFRNLQRSQPFHYLPCSKSLGFTLRG